MWDVLSKDYDSRITPAQCVRNVLGATRNGSIVVFHDSLKAEPNLRHALPAALQEWSRAGFSFKALPTDGSLRR